MHYWGGSSAANEDLMAKYLTTNIPPVTTSGRNSLPAEPYSPSERMAKNRAEKGTTMSTSTPAGPSASNGSRSGRSGQGIAQQSDPQVPDFIQSYNPFAV